MHANRLTLMQRVFGRGIRIILCDIPIHPFAASHTDPRYVNGRNTRPPPLYSRTGFVTSCTTRSGLVCLCRYLVLLYTTIKRRNAGVYRLNRRLSSFVRSCWQLPGN